MPAAPAPTQPAQPPSPAPAAPAAPTPPAQSGSAVPPSSGEIRVSEMFVSDSSPKPGSARAKAFDKLRSMAKTLGAPEEPAPVKPAEQAEAPEAGEEGQPAEAATAVPGEEPSPGEEPAAKPEAPTPEAKPGKDKKISPWKLLDDAKARLANAEKELSDTKSRILPDADKKAFEERVTKAEARVKELEDHMRFVDYSKSAEFQEKHQKPYEAKWRQAMAELGEITIDDGQGGQRPVNANDLLELVNMPLGKAREVADSVFGSFADDVMAHRKEIRNLFDAQSQALEEARKTGAEREKKQMEEARAKHGEIGKAVSELWVKENEAVIKNEAYGKLFTQRDGDQQWNDALTKGFELVDKSFGESPMNPDLSPEERQGIIRRHAAIRNRAAAWGAMRIENSRLQSKVAEMEKELAQYKAGEPGTGGAQTQSNAPAQPASAMSRAFQNLHKYAKPG